MLFHENDLILYKMYDDDFYSLCRMIYVSHGLICEDVKYYGQKFGMTQVGDTWDIVKKHQKQRSYFDHIENMGKITIEEFEKQNSMYAI